MPRKKQTKLDIPKTRRHIKQKNKKTVQDDIVQIGGSAKQGIHQEHLDETDKMLRAFDLNYAYGPCVGIKRIDRWERARQLGLNPPPIIKDILINDQTNKNAESLFNQFRMI
ncbi:DNA polymerase delta, subunit 4-domain-containing protein [Mucor mucedo]|uniref:DNA polymerase delta, subunit 4-domain-containing protein n=1 Tax=Mucor mucedo TaxID=29922 RepID=UPI00221EA8C7|nr:DNA polymerase delta, subunit 4-domain-containing protein [Mucor mucedo]KAI7896355.1 DNA polymerase delta, subunit 4-domain-containing protein [Mucor mucedo]